MYFDDPLILREAIEETHLFLKNFTALDNIPDKKRGLGVILCLYDRKLYLKEDVISLPIEYI